MFLSRFLPNAADYEAKLRCFPVTLSNAVDNSKVKEVNYGGKILLPNSVLDNLIRLNIQYPLLFKIINPETQRLTHCGVLEFSSEEGRCYLPEWMMRQLSLSSGSIVSLHYVNLPPATYAKFKPMSTDFLQITNPRAMLEIELRKFACLTKGDVIAVEYNDQVLAFKLIEVRPGNAVTIIECDVNVEFDAPEGYVEQPQRTEMPEAPQPRLVNAKQAIFSGSGQRLDGKATKRGSRTPLVSESADDSGVYELGPLVPQNDYKPGHLVFPRYNYKNRAFVEKELAEKNSGGGSNFKAFEGRGYTLRSR